ncbi:MAG: hypothetical protein IT332_12705 [Ardenticatenales bacterium]|nr:hypothetical protein [Ardenticatenales bacterium]
MAAGAIVAAGAVGTVGVVATFGAVGAVSTSRAALDPPLRLVLDGRQWDVSVMGGPAVPDSRSAGLDAAAGRVAWLPYAPELWTDPDGASGTPVVDVGASDSWPATARWTLGLGAWAVRTDGRRIVVAGQRATGVHRDRPATFGVFGLADDGSVGGVGAVDIDGSPSKIEMFGDRAYTLEDRHDLRVIDLSDPARPRASGRWNVGSRPDELAAGPGGAVYLLYADRVDVVDARDMVKPRRAGTLPGLRRGRGLAVSPDGRVLWVLDEEWQRPLVLDGRVIGFDLADPLHPAPAASTKLPGLRDFGDGVIADFGPIMVDANERWLALAADGLAVFDVSDPLRPTLALRAPLPRRAVGLALDGDGLYIAEAVRTAGERPAVARFRLSDGSEWPATIVARAWLPVAFRPDGWR